MPTTVFTATHFLSFNGADNGTTLTLTGMGDFPSPFPVVDQNDDGNLDSIGGSPDHLLGPSIPYSGYTIEINGNTYAIFEDTANVGSYYIPYDSTFDDIDLADVPAFTTDKSENVTAQNFCFLGGTLIATPSGERAVETLEIGDMVRTAGGRDVVVKWVGRQRVTAPLFNISLDEKRALVCIVAGALGNHTDLYVSADHGMIVDGLVINASALVNGTTIRFVPATEMPQEFTYYHVETEAHDVILANGTPVETFIDYVGRQAFDNYGEYLESYGVERIIPEMPHPRISTARLLPEDIKARLGISSQDRLSA